MISYPLLCSSCVKAAVYNELYAMTEIVLSSFANILFNQNKYVVKPLREMCDFELIK